MTDNSSFLIIMTRTILKPTDLISTIMLTILILKKRTKYLSRKVANILFPIIKMVIESMAIAPISIRGLRSPMIQAD